LLANKAGTILCVFEASAAAYALTDASVFNITPLVWDIDSFFGLYIGNSGKAYAYEYDTAERSANIGTGMAASAAYHAVWRRDATTISGSVNGAAVVSAACSGDSTRTAVMRLGGIADAFMPLYIAELVFCNVAISDSDRAGWNSYVRARYGI
jgi:hypothetical protein